MAQEVSQLRTENGLLTKQFVTMGAKKVNTVGARVKFLDMMSLTLGRN